MEHRKETVVSISTWKMQVYLFLLAIVMIIAVQFVHALLFDEVVLQITLSGLGLFTVAMIIIVCLHEAIHLLGFRYIGGVPRKELAWGFNWKLGVAYAHAKKSITVEEMKKVLLLPLIPTGILPLIVGIAMNFPAISVLGVLLTVGSFGDLVLYHKLRKLPNDALVLDHPTKPQFTVYE
ncbi:DUF3267 domain-containing protein [Oceanobacillus salinisoli]|uniref:DUF3267 domain-containing protein n=1 Tax=Oceanobacillus salinisoli TaxID=2678611 RepID=UPI0012E17DAA|nr:DUF3267 domain-containing protein [Oceanobacillus salinisoli]